jgi:transposase InsO family protein
VPPNATQAVLREAFTKWGRPDRLRVDNGAPWGSPGDLPTDLELWLKGLGVGLECNPPRSPQDNGVVERSQGTAKRWGEPGQCDTFEELQARLDLMDKIQREEYPSLAGRSRLEAHPSLVHSGRSYTPQWEETDWDFEAAAARLAGYAARRLVSSEGKISVYNKSYGCDPRKLKNVE